MRGVLRGILVAISILLLVPAAGAQTDPDPCAGVTVQPDPLDLSAGSARLCFPTTDENGTTIPSSKTLECSVVFLDGTGNTLDTQTFTGGPGASFPVNVPRDGVGTAQLSCTMDGMTSTAAATPPTVIYPASSAPSRPIVLPGQGG